MDGVLANVYPLFFELYEEETGLRKTISEVIGLKEGEAFPEVFRWVETPGFFRKIPVMICQRWQQSLAIAVPQHCYLMIGS